MLMRRSPWRVHLQEHRHIRPKSDSGHGFPLDSITSSGFSRCLEAALLLASIFNCEIVRAQAKNSAAPANPKIRAITAFINLDRPRYQQEIADALKMLRRAQTTFESTGYQVQTSLIATQPFPEDGKAPEKEQAIKLC